MYRISLSRDNFTFSAAHFVIGRTSKARELLHGHNYRVTASIESPELNNEVVVDFAPLKHALVGACSILNHRTLLPSKNIHLHMGMGESSVGVRAGEASFIFPRSDVVVLPLANVTCETLAEWIAGKVHEHDDLALHTGMRVEITVEECLGQSGGYSFSISEHRTPVPTAADSVEHHDFEQRSMRRALDLASKASESGSSPFGAVIAAGGRYVAEATNETAGDSAVDHAEVVALRRIPSIEGSSAARGDFVLYASCEPCLMCLMAAHYSGITKVVYATSIGEAVVRDSGDLQVDARAFAAALGLPIEIVGPVDPLRGREIFDTHMARWGKL